MGNVPTAKACRKCGIEKPLDAFYRDAGYRGGYTAQCQACRRDGSDALRARYLARSPAELLAAQPPSKRCGRCRVVKASGAFHRNPRLRDGLGAFCIECHGVRRRQRAAQHAARSSETIAAARPTEKRCFDCGTVKPLSEFYAAVGSADGLASACQVCSRERARVYVAAHPAEVSARGRARYVVNKAAMLAHEAARYRTDPAYAARKKATAAAWRAAHPERKRASDAKRKAMMRRAPVTLLDAEVEAIVRSANGRCGYCGQTTTDLELDHIVPLSTGGPHARANVIPACAGCNNWKRAKPVEHLLARLTDLSVVELRALL